MKKKLFISIFSTLLILIGFFTLIMFSKPEKVISQINIINLSSNFNYGTFWYKGEFSSDTPPTLDDYKLILTYNDGTSIDIDENNKNLSVVFRYTDTDCITQSIENLEILNSGYYDIVFYYDCSSTVEARISFRIN